MDFSKDFLKYIAGIALCMLNVAYAESDMNLAKTVQNPLRINPEARHFALPFVNYTNFDYGTNQNTQNILDLKPVAPFRFTQSLDLILRTIIPITHQPNNHGYINGLGDINPTPFIAPAQNTWFLWGIGPTLVMPTATNKALGAGKWSIGPELVLIAMPSKWTLAILTDGIWSVAGDPSRPAVQQFSFQYFITYNFPRGWYVTTQPNMVANLAAKPGQVWTVPAGIGAGRTFKIANQAVDVSLQGYYNVARPTTGERWTLQATFELLFDDKRITMP